MLVTFCKTGGGVGNTDFLKYMITFVTSPLNKQTVIKPGTKPSLKFGGLPQFLFFPTILLVGLLVIIVWEFLYHIKGNVPHFFLKWSYWLYRLLQKKGADTNYLKKFENM